MNKADGVWIWIKLEFCLQLALQTNNFFLGSTTQISNLLLQTKVSFAAHVPLSAAGFLCNTCPNTANAL